MNRRSFSTLALAALALITLPHCARYKPQGLALPAARTEKNQVEFAARELSAQEFKQCFDTRLNFSQVVPLQICVVNNSDQSFMLDASQLNVSLLPVKAVAEKLHRNTAGRAAGYGVAGLFLWPLWIPAVVDGIKSSEANKDIDVDMNNRAFGSDSQVEIMPHSTFNRVALANRSTMPSQLNVALFDRAHRPALSFTYAHNAVNVIK